MGALGQNLNKNQLLENIKQFGEGENQDIIE
jgi:hypothetical protein